MEQQDTESDYSDFVITVSGQEFKCSKWVLARHSVVFRDMFKSCPSTTKMEIDDVTPTDMELFLLMLNATNKSKFALNMGKIARSLELARKYGAGIVMQHCEEYLLQSVQDRTQSAALAAIADTYDMPTLRQAAVQYLSQLSVPTSALLREELSKCKGDTVFDIFQTRWEEARSILMESASLPVDSLSTDNFPDGWNFNHYQAVCRHFRKPVPKNRFKLYMHDKTAQVLEL
eukprot:jgi/Chlat1/2586/Chrsp178S00151